MDVRYVDPNLCSHAELFGYLIPKNDVEVRLKPNAIEG